METGLQPSAASDWPVAPKKRGLEGPLWSVHGCPFVCPSTGQRKPSSLTLSVFLVLKVLWAESGACYAANQDQP